jgi:ABC-2 type transport system permease protein
MLEAGMKKIKTILIKEWMEVFKNKMVIFTVAFLPLMMVTIPLSILYSTRGSASALTAGQLPDAISQQLCPSGLTGSECFQVYMVSQFMLLFMLIPVVIPGVIAAYSIVGEKTTRSLEPLLATPITTIELLVGKCLAAVIPAIITTYGAYAIFTLGASILVSNKTLLSAFFEPRWLIAILVVGPLLAILATTFALMVSSRVNDPRVAEQISMVIIIPVMAGFFGQVSGLFVLNTQLISIVAFLMLALDVLMIYLASQVFDRESILTRWR